MTVRFWLGWAIAAEWGHGVRRWGHRVARAPPRWCGSRRSRC